MGNNARGQWEIASDTEDSAYAPGFWYTTHEVVGAVGTSIVANNTRMVPFRIRQTVDIVTLGARITTLAVGGFCQFGIYRANANTLLPTGRPVATTGNVATDTAVNVSGAITQGRVQLARGIYWFAATVDNSTVLFQAPVVSTTAFWVGGPTQDIITSAAGNANSHRVIAATVFANWPDLTDPASTTAAAGQNCALGQFQVAP